MAKDSATLQRLLASSKQEFLANGFENASLRNIAAAAGLTTGAIFGYFKNKNAIFEALVNPICDKVERFFTDLADTYYNADGTVYEINMQKSMDDLRLIYDIAYENFDEFRLLICCAEGSSKSDFVHTIIEYEIAHSLAYIERLKKKTQTEFSIDEISLHILCDSYINSLLEPVRHNMSYADAIKSVEFLGVFYTGGWEAVFNSCVEAR